MTIAINLAGPCLSTCDPPGGDLTHLALVTVSNTGAATAYLQACGTNPAMNEQLLDSCTISPDSLTGRMHTRIALTLRTLVAPVGLRYHALHHWIPSLPYHNLGRAHRRLVTALTADAPYGRTIAPGFTPVILDLVQRSNSTSRARS